MIIDLLHLMYEYDEPASMSQQDHICRFNELGRIMAAMPDIYETGKLGDSELIKSLQTDFDRSWFISSTRIHYEKYGLEGTITHYFGSIVVDPVETKLIIPSYNHISLNDVLDIEQGLTYFQALFNTTDSADEIKDTLYKLSGKTSKESRVWTHTPEDRKSTQDKAAGLGYDVYSFHIESTGNILIPGRSRGVSFSPR